MCLFSPASSQIGTQLRRRERTVGVLWSPVPLLAPHKFGVSSQSSAGRASVLYRLLLPSTCRSDISVTTVDIEDACSAEAIGRTSFELEFHMVDTAAVYKLPVDCAACGSQQYETLLRIHRGSVTCIECHKKIETRHASSGAFRRAAEFIEWARSCRLTNA
jgi:hypothetical protein